MSTHICTFFGHRDCTVSIRKTLYDTVKELIVEHSVHIFYVGCNGLYDLYVYETLKSLSSEFNIKYYIVLSYLRDAERYPNENTIYPEGIELIPQRFAISWRNKWMVNKSDFVVCYITHSFGGAAQFYEYSKKNGKIVINIAEETTPT